MIDGRIKMLAEATVEGSFGNGVYRRKILGDDYEKVQKMINSMIIEKERRRGKIIRKLALLIRIIRF